MRIEVRLFAMQRVQTGERALEPGAARGSDVADAWAALVAELPGPGAVCGSVRFARNGATCEADDPSRTGTSWRSSRRSLAATTADARGVGASGS